MSPKAVELVWTSQSLGSGSEGPWSTGNYTIKNTDRNLLHAHLEQQKRLFKTANDRKGQFPQKKFTRTELNLLFHSGGQPSKAYGLRQTVVGYAYPPCILPLASLTSMIIDDLRLETHHRGRVLVVRAFGYPAKWQAVQNAVEDSVGGVERLAVYNFDPTQEGPQVLPKGGLFAIKEPYCKMTGDGMTTIRVDHPTDLVRLEESDEIVPIELQPRLVEPCMTPAAALKENGNTAFKVENYHDAEYQYSRALKVCGEQDILLTADIYRNRAIVNLYLARHEAALVDAEKAIVTEPTYLKKLDLPKTNGKAYYRAGCAAYHIQDFEKARACFNKVKEIDPSDVDADRELNRTNARLLEQLQGRYDFEAMAKAVLKKRQRLDHASHTAKITIRDTSDRGRGLFSTINIKAGELVFCEKAFSMAYDDGEAGNCSVILNLGQDSISMGTQATRLVDTIHKLLHSPKQATEFLKLYDGEYSPKTSVLAENGLVALDTFRVQAILEYNGFGCPSTMSSENTDDKSGGPTGVWVMASYANHDCVGSVSRAFIGDVMVVYAMRDIEKGEEITMRYNSPDAGIAVFQEALEKAWKFRCSCLLCRAEAKVPAGCLKRRDKALREAIEFLKSPANKIAKGNLPRPSAIAQAEKLRAKVESTYDNELFRGLPRLALTELDLWLCKVYVSKNSEKVQDVALTLLRDLGIMVIVEKNEVTIDRTTSRLEIAAIHGATYAAEAFEQRGQGKVGQRLRELGKELYKMYYGSECGYDEKFR